MIISGPETVTHYDLFWISRSLGCGHSELQNDNNRKGSLSQNKLSSGSCLSASLVLVICCSGVEQCNPAGQQCCKQCKPAGE